MFLPDDFESSTSAPETVTKTSMSLDALQQGRKWINSRMFSKLDSCQINETNVGERCTGWLIFFYFRAKSFIV